MPRNDGLRLVTTLRTATALIERIDFPEPASSYQSYTSSASIPLPELDLGTLDSDLSCILTVINNVLNRITPADLNDLEEVDAGMALCMHLLRFIEMRVPGKLAVVVLQTIQTGLVKWCTPGEKSCFEVEHYNKHVSHSDERCWKCNPLNDFRLDHPNIHRLPPRLTKISSNSSGPPSPRTLPILRLLWSNYPRSRVGSIGV